MFAEQAEDSALALLVDEEVGAVEERVGVGTGKEVLAVGVFGAEAGKVVFSLHQITRIDMYFLGGDG